MVLAVSELNSRAYSLFFDVRGVLYESEIHEREKGASAGYTDVAADDFVDGGKCTV